MIRLLVRCGSFLACYSKLSESEARRLRAKVADPSGFAGLEIEDTGYESFEELVAACRASGWRRVGRAGGSWTLRHSTGRSFLEWMRTRGASSSVTETFEVERICKKLFDTGIKIGMHKAQGGRLEPAQRRLGAAGGRRRRRGCGARVPCGSADARSRRVLDAPRGAAER